MKNNSRPFHIKLIVGVYATGMLTLILLAASNYRVQWRDQVNHERLRYLEVFAQAITYYRLDHGGDLFPMPAETSIISNTDQCSYACPSLGTSLPCYNITEHLVPSYMKRILQDPMLTSDSDTGFYITEDDGQVTLGACHHFFNKPIRHTVPLQ